MPSSDTVRKALADFLRPPPVVRDLRKETELLSQAQTGTIVVSPGTENTEEQIHYYRWGSGDHRVLLIHGWGGKASQYFAFVEQLISEGIEVVGFDAPAHGRSSGEFASGPAFARAAIETVARVGPVGGLIAHSLGAAASAIAILEGLAVRKIVLLAPVAQIFPLLENFAERHHLAPAEREALFAMFSAKYRRRILSVTEAVRDFAGEGLIFHDPDDPEVPFAQGAAMTPRTQKITSNFGG